MHGMPDERTTILLEEWRPLEPKAKGVMQPQGKHTYIDAMTGQPIDSELVAAARRTFDEIEAVQAQGEIVYRDAISGQALNTEFVNEARRKEMEYFEAKGVCIEGHAQKPSQ